MQANFFDKKKSERLHSSRLLKFKKKILKKIFKKFENRCFQNENRL